jgi:hypothetical protein
MHPPLARDARSGAPGLVEIRTELRSKPRFEPRYTTLFATAAEEPTACSRHFPLGDMQ